jgi:hypothetical protein
LKFLTSSGIASGSTLALPDAPGTERSGVELDFLKLIEEEVREA